MLRRAAVTDAESIALVLGLAFAEYEPQYTPAAFAATVPAPDAIRARWDEGPVWVAVRDQEIVGTVAAMLENRDVYVRSMAIAPKARGLQLGMQLLAEVERYAREAGAARLYLSTTPFLFPAIRLYERCGFRRTAEGPHWLSGTSLFTMEKLLARNEKGAAT